MWSTTIESIPGGKRYRLQRSAAELSFRDYLTALGNDVEFANWYTDQLASCKFAACFWEHPPLTTTNADRGAEFVLVDAPSMVGVAANSEPFSNQFSTPDGPTPVCFPSLGHDAMLIAPGPGVGPVAGPHLLTFVRQARRDQVLEFWRLVSRTALAQLSNSPMWLSTSGLGVYWLHVRVDSIPKYYQYSPYRTTELSQE